MPHYTRRHFFRWMGMHLAALFGAKAIAACGRGLVDVPPLLPTSSQPAKASPAVSQASPSPSAEAYPTSTPTSQAPTTNVPPAPTSQAPATSVPPTPTHPPQPTPSHTPLPPSPTPTVPAGPAYLAVARNGEPRELVRRAIQALGGIGAFVHPGNNVIIKPNICVAYRSYEYAATTNPWVVGALVELAFEAGANRVRVMDYPFDGTCDAAYARSGIQEQVQAAGGEMEFISLFKFVQTDIPEGRDLGSCYIYEDILTADVVINVPIAKHHGLARLTLGMKNLMGTLMDRPPMHHNMGQRLADVTSRIRPALTVVDAVRILVANGPSGGNLGDVRKLDTVIASADIVAADSYAATLFGVDPQSLSYIQTGTAMGLGRSDLENLRLEEINLGA